MAIATKRGKRTPAKAVPANKDAANGDAARIHCLIPADLHKRVKVGCALEDVTITDVIAELLEARFPLR